MDRTSQPPFLISAKPRHCLAFLATAPGSAQSGMKFTSGFQKTNVSDFVPYTLDRLCFF
jgi:hypothetical protein